MLFLSNRYITERRASKGKDVQPYDNVCKEIQVHTQINLSPHILHHCHIIWLHCVGMLSDWFVHLFFVNENEWQHFCLALSCPVLSRHHSIHSLTRSLTQSSLYPFPSFYQHWIAQPRETYLGTKETQIMQGLKVTEVKSMKYITDKKVS